MQKRGLKDVKRRNRQVILEAVMESSGLSRVEIAQKTRLAASTVSTLVGELLSDGILAEAGTVTTAGRSRTELTVNPAYGCIAVVEIARRESSVTLFDMMLEPVKKAVLSKRFASGNELLERISRCIAKWQEDVPPIMGIGLLFQEDMRESDFRVMYSTGFASASITLREALMTQFRVPIEEEYSLKYTVTNALAKETDLDASNSAHISIGSRVLASVSLEGKTVPLRSGFCEELMPAFDQADPQGTEPERAGGLCRLANLIALLCILFPLDTVFISGWALHCEDTEQTLVQRLREKLPEGYFPRLRFLQMDPPGDSTAVMARQVLKKALVQR